MVAHVTVAHSSNGIRENTAKTANDDYSRLKTAKIAPIKPR